MSNLAGFNASEVEPVTTNLMPVGDYTAAIVQSEVKPTKSGSGQYLELVWQILEGEYSGRKIFDRLNIQNQNQVAQQIGQQALSAVCHAVGILQPNDSSDLHDIPVRIQVKISKGKDGYDDSNDIKGYEPLNLNSSNQSPRPAMARQPADQSKAQNQASAAHAAASAAQSNPGPAWAR